MTGSGVSVIVPCLNADEFLDEQLGALAAQTYDGPMEVLVADNGSTDNSRAMVSTRARTDSRFRLVNAAAVRGAAAARNVGVGASSYDYLLFVDADDVVEADYVEHMVRGLNDHSLVLARIDSSRLNPSWASDAWVARSQLTAVPAQLAAVPIFGAGVIGIRRSTFVALGGFDAALKVAAEDNDLEWRAKAAGISPAFIHEAVLHYRLRATVSGTLKQQYRRGRGTVEVRRRHGKSCAVSWRAVLGGVRRAVWGPTSGARLGGLTALARQLGKLRALCDRTAVS